MNRKVEVGVECSSCKMEFDACTQKIRDGGSACCGTCAYTATHQQRMMDVPVPTAEIPIDELKKMLELLPRSGANLGTVADMIRKHIPKPNKQRYYVLYYVDYQPEESADPNVETPPMDMTHSLTCNDPRFQGYGMEEIGPLEAIVEWAQKTNEEMQ